MVKFASKRRRGRKGRKNKRVKVSKKLKTALKRIVDRKLKQNTEQKYSLDLLYVGHESQWRVVSNLTGADHTGGGGVVINVTPIINEGTGPEQRIGNDLMFQDLRISVRMRFDDKVTRYPYLIPNPNYVSGGTEPAHHTVIYPEGFHDFNQEPVKVRWAIIAFQTQVYAMLSPVERLQLVQRHFFPRNGRHKQELQVLGEQFANQAKGCTLLGKGQQIFKWTDEGNRTGASSATNAVVVARIAKQKVFQCNARLNKKLEISNGGMPVLYTYTLCMDMLDDRIDGTWIKYPNLSVNVSDEEEGGKGMLQIKRCYTYTDA